MAVLLVVYWLVPSCTASLHQFRVPVYSLRHQDTEARQAKILLWPCLLDLPIGASAFKMVPFHRWSGGRICVQGVSSSNAARQLASSPIAYCNWCDSMKDMQYSSSRRVAYKDTQDRPTVCPAVPSPLVMEHHTQSDAEKPTVIGLYGLPGCGKSTMLRSTKDRFGTQSFDFLEGSDAIANVVPGGLEAFKALPATEKVDLRGQAILKVAKDALAKGCVAVLAGYCSFWPAIDDTISWIFTEADASTYTHIIYLNTAAELIHEQCRSDSEKERETLSLSA
ncbi:hypothetical protein MRB53_038325 [Persea americana]|nr:hypothetical protein MRB53_038325 [Persea americana]